MAAEVSDNTKAILLLTAPLIVGKGGDSVKPLTLAEYNKLARGLSEAGRQPADLLETEPSEALPGGHPGLDPRRIRQLIERGFLLSQALERWQARAIWVVSRADAGYPQRLKSRLGAKAPAVLYGCGREELLEQGGLAVVGSRHTSQELLEYAEGLGRLAAAADCAIISGGAKGVDAAAMRGALQEPGGVVGVLTGELESGALNPEYREPLGNGQLALISPYDPKTRFNVGNAMQRNKLIYALADAGLVVDSDDGKGGTWNGAVEQLDKLRLAPIYARAEGPLGAGLKGLLRKGALPWPNPANVDDFRAARSAWQLPDATAASEQAPLLHSAEKFAEFGEANAPAPIAMQPSIAENNTGCTATAGEALLAKVEELLAALGPEVTEAEVAEYLNVEQRQASSWLKRLTEKGHYTKPGRVSRYVRTTRLML